MYISRANYNKATITDHSLDKTLSVVERFSKQYYTDLLPFKDYSLRDFFNFVAKDIRYVPDPEGIERVCRPQVTLNIGFGDCDDKTVLCLAFFIMKQITCGYSIISNKKGKSFHHIFPFIIVNNKQYDYDATYNTNKPYITKTYVMRQNKIIYEGLT